MTPELTEKLESLCRGPIAAAAIGVDKSGQFPEASIAALAQAGLLGAISAPESGGLGLGIHGAALIARRVARECGSTAMVLCMHYCGTAVLDKFATPAVRKSAASGEHLSTLAFSEAGSRSHFWAPSSTAVSEGAEVVLDARKSWITSASRAAAYVWSSRPVSAPGLSTLWLVPANAAGLTIHGAFEGLGLRGNDSSPVTAAQVRVPADAVLGADGAGFDIMMGVVLPYFSVLNAAVSIGIMEGAVERTAAHASATRHSDTGASLAELPTIRAYIARMRVKTDLCAALLEETLAAMQAGKPETMLRVLEVKAAAGETATEVTDLAMRVCGGAAYRKEVGVERAFRDARAAGIMAPTTDALYDFIGKAVCGLPLF